MSALILRVNKSGQPMNWIDWQDAVLLYAREQVIWWLGEDPLRIYGGFNRVSNQRSYIDVHPIVAARGAVKHSHFAGEPPLNNKELFRRDGHTCMYCLTELADRKLTRDHLIPVSRGGKDEWNNVVTACRHCNQKKADRLVQESGMRLHAIPYAPNYAEWLILRNRHILADQMTFLQAQCPKERRNLF